MSSKPGIATTTVTITKEATLGTRDPMINEEGPGSVPMADFVSRGVSGGSALSRDAGSEGRNTVEGEEGVDNIKAW